jgi:type II secretory pathway component PulF
MSNNNTEHPKINIEPEGDFAKRIAELIKSGKTVDEAYQIYHEENQKEK